MSKEEKGLLLPAISIILSIILFFVSWKMLMPSIADNQSKIKAHEADIVLAETKTQSLIEANKRIGSMSGLVNNLLVAIPENADAPNLIAEIESIALANQVLLPSIAPPGINEQLSGSDSNSFSTTISVTGSFGNINNFINGLENSIRFLKINTLSLSSGEDKSLNATITFEVYKRPELSRNLLESGVDYE